MQYDLIVTGGSYAGMAAALQLVRARRTVLVIDAGERRNRFAGNAHAFLGHDGVDAGEIAANARRQLETYPTLTWLQGRVDAVSGGIDAFLVTTADGGSHRGRRLLLAVGMTDQLPSIHGLAERWGSSVFLCPYCHGYELDQGRIGVIATDESSLHQAQFLTEWGQVTLLTNEAIALDGKARSALEDKGVAIEEVPIDRLEGTAGVRLRDGRLLAFAGLFTTTRCVPSGGIAQAAGCAMDETATGLQVRIDDENQTSVPGVFACGDAARGPHSLSVAVGDGAVAGLHIHGSLLGP